LKKLISTLLLTAICTFAACSGYNSTVSSTQHEKLYVFAAASLTGCFSQMAEDFEKSSDGRVQVILNFAGSQALRTSIQTGAKADIFAAADLESMKELKKAGFITNYVFFAKNRLALVKSIGSKYEINSWTDLAADGLKLAAADKSLPVGSYWEKLLGHVLEEGVISSEQKASIDKNIVTRELNVKDVMSKVLLNEADAGIVYGTDAASANKNKIMEVSVPFFDFVTADYPAAVLKESESLYAGKLLEYILSEKGKALLAKHGFIVE